MRIRLWKSMSGSASVYMMLIIAPLFLFHAVLIDFARIKMAERQSETALKTALRSTLSAFDGRLQAYGLYGLGVSLEEGKDIFENTLRHNLRGPTGGGAFALAEPVPNEGGARLTAVYSLANQTVFRQQVLEEMKYRAPVEFTVNVIDKFRNRTNLMTALTGTSKFAKQAERIDPWLQKREAKLDEAWEFVQTLGEKTRIYRSYYAGRLSELNDLASQIGLRDAEDIQSSVRSLKRQAEELKQSLDSSRSSLQELLRDAKKNAQQIAEFQATISGIEQSLADLYEKIGELEALLQTIARYALLLESTKAEVKRDEALVRGWAQSAIQLVDEARECDEEIRKIAGESEASSTVPVDITLQVLLSEEYYTRYKIGAGSVEGLFGGFSAAVDATTPFAGANRFDADRYQTLSESNEAYAGRAKQLIEEMQPEETKRREMGQSANSEKRRQLQRTNEVIDQIKNITGHCGTGDEAVYQTLEKGNSAEGQPGLARKYSDYNRLGTPESPETALPNDGIQARSNAIGMIDRFVEKLTEALQSFRDELYINEFALAKFNYRTYGQEKGADGQIRTSHELSDPGSHSLFNQEAEYMLYGLNSCMKNQAAAYGEMFAFRLAIRTAEALMSPKEKLASFGSPLLLLLWAVAEGAAHAYGDMTRLINGEEVPLSAKLPESVTMNYKDYLRLFYLLHSSDAWTMARMQALIELNTGQDLRDKYTYVQASVTSSERLWFMPYLMKMFSYSVIGGRVQLDQTAVFSY